MTVTVALLCDGCNALMVTNTEGLAHHGRRVGPIRAFAKKEGWVAQASEPLGKNTIDYCPKCRKSPLTAPAPVL